MTLSYDHQARIVFILVLACTTSAVHATSTTDATNKMAPIRLDLPLIEAPLNFGTHDYTFPTMRQSLEGSNDFYFATHRALGGDWRNHRWRIWLVMGEDLLMEWLPLGSAWMHEEWHRAVMSNRGIGSYNDVYNFPIGSSLIAVSHVTDEDLIRLKRDFPADQVRLSAAGMESQTVQNIAVEKRHFYDNVDTFDEVLLLSNTVGNIFYMWTCATSQANSSTDSQNNSDGSNVSKRDFTGLDCTGWVYDLFRPDEPYAARGVHPSGVGINRYIRYSDLTGKERDFLRRNAIFSSFNLVDPFLLGFDRFHTTFFGEDVTWNARFSHYLTSFGYTIDANLFWQMRGRKMFAQLHNGVNDSAYFPGLTLQWLDEPMWGTLLTVGATLWSQPRGQRVTESNSSMLIDGMARVKYPLTDRVFPYVEVEAKTPGWIAGNVFLDRDVTTWLGFEVTAF